MRPVSLTTLHLPLGAHRRGCLLAAAWLLIAGVGCARRPVTQQAEAANIPSATAVRLLGNVRVIGTGGRFVLVEASVVAVAASLADGQTLVCRAAGADTATLRVSHERRPPFVITDVANGEPHVGDEVFVVPASVPMAKPPATAPAVAPPTAPLFRTDPAPPTT